MLVAAVVFGAACEAPTETLAPEIDAQFAKAGKEDPHCKPKKLKDDQKGKISKNDCLYTENENGQREDLYTVDGAGGGQMMTFTATAEFDGIFGIMEAGQELFQGTVWGSRGFTADEPGLMKFVGGSPTYEMFFSGGDASQLGKYTLTTEVGPVSYQCGGGVFFLEGTVGFDQYMDGNNSCEYLVEYSPFPEAIGQPIWTHGYNAKLMAGESYTVTIDGANPSFQPTLTVFSYAGGFSVIAQDFDEGSSDTAREATFSLPFTGYVYIEISSGRGDGEGGWVQEEGTYGFSFSRN
jgi:hypothetical protein